MIGGAHFTFNRWAEENIWVRAEITFAIPRNRGRRRGSRSSSKGTLHGQCDVLVPLDRMNNGDIIATAGGRRLLTRVTGLIKK
jgi:hypothetical protein